MRCVVLWRDDMCCDVALLCLCMSGFAAFELRCFVAFVCDGVALSCCWMCARCARVCISACFVFDVACCALLRVMICHCCCFAMLGYDLICAESIDVVACRVRCC